MQLLSLGHGALILDLVQTGREASHAASKVLQKALKCTESNIEDSSSRLRGCSRMPQCFEAFKLLVRVPEQQKLLGEFFAPCFFS